MTETPKSASLDEEYETNITLSYEYAEKSIKEVQDASNHINTQLGLLIGFNLTFIRFFINNLPNKIYNLDFLLCNSCLLLKILAYVLSIASIVLCLAGLYKTIDYNIIKPNILVQNCDHTANVELKLAILDTWNEKLDNFINLVSSKKQLFNYSIILLLLSGLIAILDTIIAKIFY
ncbi:MAG: hypothetical protein ACEQSC_00860 [Candidatus Nanopelagicaceae bacterium]|jgi:hypothetical protein